MPKKNEPEDKIVRSSTTHLVKDTSVRVAEGGIVQVEATVTVEHEDGSVKDSEPVSISLEPVPSKLTDWLAVANFVLETAEAIKEAQEDDDDAE
jgi:hypothetical protein